jgi:hypothetical protein
MRKLLGQSPQRLFVHYLQLGYAAQVLLSEILMPHPFARPQSCLGEKGYIALYRLAESGISLIAAAAALSLSIEAFGGEVAVGPTI